MDILQNGGVLREREKIELETECLWHQKSEVSLEVRTT